MTALRDPDVFHFGDLLLSARAQLGEVSEFMPLLEVLSIFAFGTLSDLSDFQRRRASPLALPDDAILKLKQLTLLSLCSEHKTLRTEDLLRPLSARDSGEVEDIVLQCVGAGLFAAKIDQRRQVIVVHSCVGRDVPSSQLDEIIVRLQHWQAACASVLAALGQQHSTSALQQEILMREKEAFDAALRQKHSMSSMSSSHLKASGAHADGGSEIDQRQLKRRVFAAGTSRG